MNVKKVMFTKATLQHQKRTWCNCVIKDMKSSDLSQEHTWDGDQQIIRIKTATNRKGLSWKKAVERHMCAMFRPELHRVSKKKLCKIVFAITLSNFHRLSQFLAH